MRAAMRRLLMFLTVLNLTACAKDSGSPVPSESETAPEASGSAATAGSAIAPTGSGSGSATVAPPVNGGADEVARLVVDAVGSKALGNQKIETSCVSVSVLPAGDWTVAAARLKDCGNKTARSILWVFKRMGNGKWNEDYAAQPPRCWKGIPADIADAVWKTTKIPGC
jgi:hypothetical protein